MATAKERGVRALVIVAGIALVAALVATALGSVIDVADRPAPDPARADSDGMMAWIARIVLVLTAGWIAIGAIATRTSLVRRPGAAAARATWLASTRPWRARESMLGLLPLDRAFMIVVPLGLLLVTRLLQVSFLVMLPSVIFVAGWIVFVVGMVVLVRPRSPWPVIAAVGGVLVFLGGIEVACFAVAGPQAFWLWLWQAPVILRVVLLTVAFGLPMWAVVAAGGAASGQVGSRRATGAAVGASGMAVTVLAALAAASGRLDVDALWQDGVVSVSIPSLAVWSAIVIGVIAAVIGSVLARTGRSARDVADGTFVG